MSGSSGWTSAGQFGDGAAEVAKCVVRGLKRGQLSARLVLAAAREAGATDNRAFGSMWGYRYDAVEKDCRLADLAGYDTFKPEGASYAFAVINGCVLIPFRHATSMNVPVGRAKLTALVPRRVAREAGILPAPTLFDTVDQDFESVDVPTVGDVVADARAANLTIVYIAYIANADSDEILAAWWGTPTSLEDDGTMLWSPERLDLSIADQAAMPEFDLRPIRIADDTPGFAHGSEPDLLLTAKTRTDENPVSEEVPDLRGVASENDE